MDGLGASVRSAVSRRGATAIARCRSGATAVEFALVAPLLFLAMLEILQGGLYLYCSASLERATATAARAIMIGGLSSGAATAAGFRTGVLCPALMPGLPCANVVTSLQTAAVGQGGAGYGAFVTPDLSGLVPVTMDNARTSYCAGAPGVYQYLQAFYAVPLISPLWRAAAGVSWNESTVVFVRSAAAFRNEPYTGASVTTNCP
jgi:Flp pilus assembly protein TadG